MFDKKLMKYNNIIGFAYKVDNDVNYKHSIIYTYLVLYDEGIKFAKYKKIENITNTEEEKNIKRLKEAGFLDVKEWVEENKTYIINNKVLKKVIDNGKDNNN